MNITEQELKQLEEAQDDVEWNRTIDEIKAKRGGAYPPDWFAKVVQANLNSKIDLSISIIRLRD